jgi:hypothetical protein
LSDDGTARANRFIEHDIYHDPWEKPKSDPYWNFLPIFDENSGVSGLGEDRSGSNLLVQPRSLKWPLAAQTRRYPGQSTNAEDAEKRTAEAL